MKIFVWFALVAMAALTILAGLSFAYFSMGKGNSYLLAIASLMVLFVCAFVLMVKLPAISMKHDTSTLE